ncbi:MAG TPA: cytochrome C oxidase subunit IV family protein [Rugosimonospora sp.]|nr:cytochrome C oxidase subunit IV family protein [Rugosimonospora sp.]
MRSILVRPVVAVWLLLVAATVLSWRVGGAHGAGRAGGVVVLTVAFLKVFLVGDHFMELRRSATLLRVVFGGWCAVLWAVLLVQYL